MCKCNPLKLHLFTFVKMQTARSILNVNLKECLQNAVFRREAPVFSQIEHNIFNYQVRHRTKYVYRDFKKKRTSWWVDDYKVRPLATRLKSAEYLTKDNEDFIQDVITDKVYSPLNVDIYPREDWKEGSVRCGLIGRKIGTYPMWNKDGKMFLPTLVQIINNTVVKYISPEELAMNDLKYRRKVPSKKFGALIVGAEDADPTMFTKEYLNIFEQNGITPKRKLSKFLVTPNAKITPGTPLFATHFKPGSKIDVCAKTIYRGYQGVMKRWGFHGLPKSHGVTKAHRAAGCTGNKKDGHWKGTKSAGFMGERLRTLRGVEILRINTKYNVLYLKGPIPGSTNGYVYLHDTMLGTHKQTEDNHQPFPTFFQEEEEVDDEIFLDKMHRFTDPSIEFK